MSTKAELLAGALFEGFEAYCTDVINAILQHYRVSDPCTNMANKNPGEILSDPDDDKLYHVGGASGYPCDEILQETRSADAIPYFASVELGWNQIRTGSRARIYLNSTQLNLNDSTWTKILLDDISYPGSGGIIDLANNKLTALVAGYYLLIGQVGFTDITADKRYMAAIYVNHANVVQSGAHAAFADYIYAKVVDVRYVDVGEDIELYGWNNSGGNAVDIIGDEKQTYLMAHLLSQ